MWIIIYLFTLTFFAMLLSSHVAPRSCSLLALIFAILDNLVSIHTDFQLTYNNVASLSKKKCECDDNGGRSNVRISYTTHMPVDQHCCVLHTLSSCRLQAA